MRKLVDLLRHTENFLMIFGMVMAVGIIFLQVILRYCFHSALPWAEELSRYLFIYFTWIGASAAISTGQHIRLDMVRSKWPATGRYLEPLVTLVCFGMAAFMFSNGFILIRTMAQNSAASPTLRLPMWAFYLAVPLGGLLMMVKYLYKFFFEDLKALRGKEA